MLITFSGLDGAGKTTLIEWLRVELERQRRSVTVLHFNDHVGIYAYLRAGRDWLLGRSPGDDPPRIEPRGTRLGRVRDALVWSTSLRRLVYPVDLLIFLCYRGYLEKVRHHVLIMDRYFYDRLVDVATGRYAGWLRLLARLTPTPDLPVFLEISPEEAFARKREYTVAYLRRRAEGYRRVRPWVPTSVHLPADELDAAKRAIAQVVRERLVP